MKKYVVAGNSLEEVKNGVKALETAVRMGATEGVGGSTLREVAEGIDALRKMNAPTPAPTPRQTDLLEALDDLDMGVIAEELAETLTDAVADVCEPLVELANRCDASLHDIMADRLMEILPDLLSTVIQQCCDN